MGNGQIGPSRFEEVRVIQKAGSTDKVWFAYYRSNAGVWRMIQTQHNGPAIFRSEHQAFRAGCEAYDISNMEKINPEFKNVAG